MKKRILSIMTALLLLMLFSMTIASANIMGDVDGNGKIQANDARLVLRASVNLETLTDEQLKAANTNGDSKISADDARLILRASVGLVTLHTHSYKGVVTTAATCTQDGVKTYTCECNEDSYTEAIPAIGHDMVEDKAVAPTCSNTGLTAGKHCSRCNDATVRQETVNKLPHTEATVASKAPTCTATGLTESKICSVCGTTIVPQVVIPSTGHKDSNKDHICDNNCGVIQGSHTDADKNHSCDYGCSELIGACIDTNKDHKCDYGCNKVYGAHEDTNKDHACDYGCSEAIGTHEDANKDHACDYGCSEAIGACEDTNKDHKCDHGCTKAYGTHEDTDKDHACDYGCSEAIGTHEDTDKDHACDYGCSEAIGAHEDADKNHACDYGCSEAVGTHEDTDKDHACDYGCSEAIGTCEDTNKDHKCDHGCAQLFGTHEDTDKDHTCEYGCSEAVGAHDDSATDDDHICDYGCGETIEACSDGDDNNHNCDICDKENVSEHDWTDATCTEAKKCSVCGEVDGEPLGHTGGNPTCTIYATCDVCGNEYLDKDNHLVFEWKEVPPSCTLDGYSAEHCTACNYFKTEGMQQGDEATGHSFGDAETVPPTCTEPGYDIKVCSKCEADEKSNFKPADDHSYDWTVTKPATCEETGLKDAECSVCHDVIENELINRTECKEFETELIVKSSNEHNIEIVKCTVCEKEQSRTEMHKTRAQTVSRLSCTTNWVIKETCSVCTEYSREYVREYTTGHEATKNVAESSDPTCETSGLLVFSGDCTKCGDSFERSEIFLPAKGHSKKEGTMQTCTTSEECKDCGKDIPGKEALGHDFDVFASAFNAHIDNFFCSRCGGTHENTLDVFNTLANYIKDTNKYYINTRGEQLITMNKTSTAMTYSRFDFGMFTDSFKEEFDKMANEPDKYSRITTTGRVSYTLPIQNSIFVSRLEKQNIESITVNQLKGLNIGEVLSGFNPTYTNQQQIELIEKYKNTSISGDILKVTININNEKYTEVKKLPQDTRTALSNIYKYDIISSAQLALNDFKGNNDFGAEGIDFTVDLKEFSTDARVTYYFKADTFDPIIALYDIDERAEIKADITIPLGLLNFKGGFDPDIKMTTTTVYLFPHLFN